MRVLVTGSRKWRDRELLYEVLDGWRALSGLDVLIEGTDFELDYPRGRLVRLHNDIPVRWYFRKLIVAYTGGYTFPGGSSPLEPDIEQAVLEIMKDIWFARMRDPLLRSDQVAGIGSQQYWLGGSAPGGTSWPPKVVDLLGPFQRPLF